MDEKNSQSPQEKIDGILKDNEEKKATIQGKIDNARTSGPQLNYNPPGTSKSLARPNVNQLRDEKRNLDANAYNEANKAIKDLPQDQQKQVKDYVTEKLYGGKNQEKLKSEGKEKKDINKSQDHAMEQKANYLAANRYKQGLNDRHKIQEGNKGRNQEKSKSDKNKQETGKQEKGKQPEKGKEKSSYSMSGRFSQSLDSRINPNKTGKSSPGKSTPSKSSPSKGGGPTKE